MRKDGQFTSRGLAIIALALALLANVVNILSDRVSQHRNCESIEVIKAENRRIFSDAKYRLSNGGQDDTFKRVYGTDTFIVVEGKAVPLWQVRKREQIAYYDGILNRYKVVDCGRTFWIV